MSLSPWLILGAGVAGSLATLPGQTNGVAPFIEFLIDALSISRVNISFAYLLGTTGSAALMMWAGAWYDRRGSRRVAAISAGALGVAVLYLSFVDHWSNLAHRMVPSLPYAFVATGVMTLGFLGVRFFGQGTLNLASRNMVMKWFDHRRGMANAIMAPLIAIGMSYGPRTFDALIQRAGWRGAWQIMAICLVLGVVPFVIVLYSDPHPATDRHAPRREPPAWRRLILELLSPVRRFLARHTAGEPHRPPVDFTFAQARATRVFWIFNAVTGFASLVGTGFTFHVVGIFATAGLTRTAALAIFFPATAIAIVIQFIGSFVSDFTRLKYFAALQMAGTMIMMVALIFLRPGFMYGLLVIGLGITTGLYQINAVITWPRFFGLSHLGRISGAGFVWMVGGSALGPYAYSISDGLSGSYAPIALVFAIIATVLFFLCFRADNPNVVSKSVL